MIFLGIASCVVTFANHAKVAMCIHVGKCPPLGDFWPIVLAG